MCHRFEMLSGEETDAVVDWLRSVRWALRAGCGADAPAPPAFGVPAKVSLEALECYPGRECSVIATETVGEGRGRVGAWEASAGDFGRLDLVWGVEVPWQKPLVFNARIESALAGSGMWREAMENGRCIVPVRAFYETRNVDEGAAKESGGASSPFGVGVEQGVLVAEEPRTGVERAVGRSHRRPQWRFAAAGATALLLAGLRVGGRFALVTTEPDAVVGRVHNRMPLTLTAPEALAWLAGAEDARGLLDRHAAVPLIAEEASPRPSKKSAADPGQLSLF